MSFNPGNIPTMRLPGNAAQAEALASPFHFPNKATDGEFAPYRNDSTGIAGQHADQQGGEELFIAMPGLSEWQPIPWHSNFSFASFQHLLNPPSGLPRPENIRDLVIATAWEVDTASSNRV